MTNTKLKLQSLAHLRVANDHVTYAIFGGVQTQVEDSSANNDKSDNKDSSTHDDTSTSYDSSEYSDTSVSSD